MADEHRYISTGCLHGQHDYCKASQAHDAAGKPFTRRPSQCKFCAAPCLCSCHGSTETSDPYVEAPGFGVTNREYWPLSQVKAAEEAATGKCGICEITWQLCRGLYDKGMPRCCSDCTHDLHAQEVTRRP